MSGFSVKGRGLIVLISLVIFSVLMSGCATTTESDATTVGGSSYNQVDTDSSYGETWTHIVENAEFGPRLWYSAFEFNDKIWVIGGIDDELGFRDDIWYSSNGRDWIQANATLDFFKDRAGQNVVVFRNKIWVIGGTNSTGVAGDIWFSDDGVIWTQAKPMAEFGPRTQLSSVVFNDRLWVIGGSSSTDFQHLRDVWYSDDGISWTPATSDGPLIVYGTQNLLVFNNKIWAFGIAHDHHENGGAKNYNDIWISENGRDWKSITPQNPFPARTSLHLIVYNNKMWVIGGNDVRGNSLDDVWRSSDGKNWKQVTPYTGFSANGTDNFSQLIPIAFDDKIWVIRAYKEENKYKNDVWYSESSPRGFGGTSQNQ